MSFCPVCISEYDENTTRCPSCNVGLATSFSGEENVLIAAAEEDSAQEELVTIFSANDYLEASMVKCMLEASGMNVVEGFCGNPVDSLSYISLRVFKSHAEEAAEIIQEQRSNPNQ